MLALAIYHVEDLYKREEQRKCHLINNADLSFCPQMFMLRQNTFMSGAPCYQSVNRSSL